MSRALLLSLCLVLAGCDTPAPTEERPGWEDMGPTTPGDPYLYRTRTPNGWLVTRAHYQSGVCYVPDAGHSWLTPAETERAEWAGKTGEPIDEAQYGCPECPRCKEARR